MPLQAMPGWGGAEGEILVVNAADPDVGRAIDVEARIFGERQNLEVPGAFDVDDGSLWFAASGSTVVREAPSSARWVAEPWDMRVAFDQRASPVDVTGVVVLVDSLARGPVWVVAAAADPARARSLARARIAELRAFDAPSTRISTSIIDVTSSP